MKPEVTESGCEPLFSSRWPVLATCGVRPHGQQEEGGSQTAATRLRGPAGAGAEMGNF